MTEDTHGVILLHGISRTARSFRKMQAAMQGAGYATLNLDYASRRKALEALAEDIHPSIQRFADGKIIEQWTEANLLSLFQQLGLVPPLR